MSVCAACEDAEGTINFDRGADFGFWTGEPQIVRLCPPCHRKADNYEPAHDGEAPTYAERVSHERDQMARIQRTLK